MKSLAGLICVILVNVLLCTVIEEGDPCQQLGVPGTCKKVRECPQAVASVGYTGKPNLQRCGFDGLEEVVCCPVFAQKIIQKTVIDNPVLKKPTTNVTANKRISEEQCEIYKKKFKNLRDSEIHITIRERRKKRFFTTTTPYPGLIGGIPAHFAEFPHMAAIGYEEDEVTGNLNFRRCGASLISPRWVLTAAHCLICAICTAPKKVRFGIIDITLEDFAQDVDLKDYIVHPDYNSTTKHNDIALLELNSSVQMSSDVYPACLYTKPDDPEELGITGWGSTVPNSLGEIPARILQKGIINPVPIKQCNTTIKNKNPYSSKTIIHSHICAISHSDTCTGDSGGPLQIGERSNFFQIVGVISYGVGCGTTTPGIYTRVYSYLDWIEGIVWPKRTEN